MPLAVHPPQKPLDSAGQPADLHPGWVSASRMDSPIEHFGVNAVWDQILHRSHRKGAGHKFNWHLRRMTADSGYAAFPMPVPLPSSTSSVSWLRPMAPSLS